MEIFDFSKQFEKLCFAFDKEYKEGQMLVYYEHLGKWKVEALKYAVSKIILNSVYFPKISELIDIMREYVEVIPIEKRLEENETIPKEIPESIKELINKWKV